MRTNGATVDAISGKHHIDISIGSRRHGNILRCTGTCSARLDLDLDLPVHVIDYIQTIGTVGTTCSLS